MSTPLIVANLDHQEALPSTLSFEHISISESWKNHHAGATVKFYKLHDGQIDMESSRPTYLKHYKAMAKARIASTILAQLFASRSGTEIRIDSANPPSVHLGDTLIVANEAFVEGDAVDSHSWNLFPSINFTFPLAVDGGTTHLLMSTQHLQVSSPTLKLDDGLFQRRDSPLFDHIEIVTGMCIFNDHILNTSLAKTGGSKVNADHLILAPASFHELDYIARCSSAVADMAAMFIVKGGPGGSGSGSGSIGIRLDVPSFHYYPSAVRAYEDGKSTATEAARWMNSVDRRNDQICSIFTRAIRHELDKRGVNQNKIEIRTTPRTNPFTTMLKHGTELGQIPSVQEVLHELRYHNNHHWREFYALIPEKELPRDLEGLAYLFYVFASVESALRTPTSKPSSTASLGPGDCIDGGAKPKTHGKHSRPGETRYRLILSVDEAVERRIYSRAQEVLRKLRSARKDLPIPVFVESYMCRRVFVNGNKTRARLYRSETAPQPVKLRDMRGPVNNGVNNGQLVEPIDVVRELYGDECAENMQTWAAEVGLALHARSEKASL